MPKPEELSTYIIKGGEQGRARLAVISRVLAPTTQALFDRFEPLAGLSVIDAGCGGGDVSFELARARRADRPGRRLRPRRDQAGAGARRGRPPRPCQCRVPQGAACWSRGRPASRAVYVRFVLTHLPKPEDCWRERWQALAPGGLIVVEDIDYDGHFCDPPCQAFDRYAELYVAAAQQRGADPFIGRRLARLLERPALPTSTVAGAAVRPQRRRQAGRLAHLRRHCRRAGGAGHRLGRRGGERGERTGRLRRAARYHHVVAAHLPGVGTQGVDALRQGTAAADATVRAISAARTASVSADTPGASVFPYRLFARLGRIFSRRPD